MADGTVDIRILIRGAREAVRQSKTVATGLDGVDRSAKKAGTSTERGRRSTERMGVALRRVGMAATIAGGALAAYGAVELKKSISHTVDFAKETIKLQDALGGSAEDNSRLVAVFKARGITTDNLFTATTKLSKAIGAAREGTGTAAESFKAFGISQDLIKKGSPIQLLKAISDGFVKLGPGFERTRRASELLGKGWMKLRPILKLGGKEIQAQIVLAGKLGNKLTEKNLTDAGKFIKSQRDMQMAMEGLRVQLGLKLLPILSDGAKAVSKFIQQWADRKGEGGRFRKKIEALWKELKPVVTGFLNATKAVGKFLLNNPKLVKVIAIFGAIGLAVKAVRFGSAITGMSSFVRAARKVGPKVLPVFRSIGRRAGSAFADSSASRAASSVGASFRAKTAKFKGIGQYVGKTMGRTAGKAFVSGIVVGFIAAGPAITRRLVMWGDQHLPGWAKKLLGFSGSDNPTSPNFGIDRRGDYRKGGRVFGFAYGGRVPGTRTMGDTVPAMLSPGEFVVTRSGEAILDNLTGVPGVLNHVGQAQRAHFAGGGRVSPMPAGAIGSSRPIITKVYLDRRQIATAVGDEVSSRAARR